MSFEDWWEGLKVLGARYDWPFIADGNEDAWREYWSEGYEPMDALREDMSYAE